MIATIMITIILATMITITMTMCSGGGGTRYLSWSVGGRQHYLCSLQVLHDNHISPSNSFIIQGLFRLLQALLLLVIVLLARYILQQDDIFIPSKSKFVFDPGLLATTAPDCSLRVRWTPTSPELEAPLVSLSSSSSCLLFISLLTPLPIWLRCL